MARNSPHLPLLPLGKEWSLSYDSLFKDFPLDVDECESIAVICDTNADCFNSAGSYQCRCRLGHQGNESNCSWKYCLGCYNN